MWTAIAIVVLALVAEAWSRRVPAPLAVDAPATRFSAGRTLAIVERLLGGGAPHPVGSAANAAVRERIVTELRAIGIEPELQSAYVCRDARVCAPVVNVLARIPGREHAPALLLASHYDSVHAGPGAADDTHGVAVMLEVARALVEGEAIDRDVVLLFDEGEEVGLLGAEAFVRAHPWAKEVDVAINVEARGTTGRAAMFETSARNGELVARYAAAVPSPEATSLSVEVYRRMPNDTDFTVLRKAGIDGINLAFIGGVARYHTPLDDLAHLDPGSVQHQGDTVLAVTQAYVRGRLPEHVADAAYTDLIGLVLVRWPARWSVPILALALLVAIGAGVAGRRRAELRALGLVLGVLAFVAIWIGAAVVGAAVIELVAVAHGGAPAAVATPLPLRVAMWAAIGLATLGLSGLVGRRLRAAELAVATWLSWAAIGLAISIAAPGAAPLFVLPVVPTAILLVIALRRRRGLDAAALFGLAAFALVWAALPYGLEDAFGWSLGLAVALPAAAMVSPAGWAFARIDDRRSRWIAMGILAAITLIAGATAMRVDVHDADHPPRFMIVHATNLDDASAILAVTPSDAALPEAMQSAASFHDAPERPLPWMRAPAWVADAAPMQREPPTLAVRESSANAKGRRVRAHLDARWADRATILIDDRTSVGALEIESEPMEPPSGDGPWMLYLFGLTRAGVDLDIETTGAEPIPVRVIACGPDLPPDAAALAAARDETAVTFQWGDAACVSQTVPL
jgi:hypothetical protein